MTSERLRSLLVVLDGIVKCGGADKPFHGVSAQAVARLFGIKHPATYCARTKLANKHVVVANVGRLILDPVGACEFLLHLSKNNEPDDRQ